MTGLGQAVWLSADGFRSTLITRHFLQPSECLKRAYTGNEPVALPLGPCKQRRWQVRCYCTISYLSLMQINLRGLITRGRAGTSADLTYFSPVRCRTHKNWRTQ